MKIKISLCVFLYLLYVSALNAQTDTVFFDNDWKVTDTKSTASFFRVKNKTTGNQYNVRDYYINGLLQMEGFYTNPADEKTKNGPFIYYDTQGKPESKVSFINNLTEGVAQFYYKGRLVSTQTFKNGLLNGPALYIDSFTQAKRAEGIYKDDKRQGEWRFYITNGSPEYWITFDAGRLEGPTVIYDTITGKVYAKGQYKADEKWGKWIYYDDDVKFEEGTYLNDRRDGEWIFFYTNAKPASIQQWKNGTKNGSYIIYDSLTGNKVLEVGYKNGEMNGGWTSFSALTSKKILFVSWENGIRKGKTIMYDSISGEINAEGYLEGENKEGQWMHFYKGHLQQVSNYKNNKLEGRTTWYDTATHKKIEEGEYADNQKNGTWKYYNPSTGELYKQVTFLKGVSARDQVGSKSLNLEGEGGDFSGSRPRGQRKYYYGNTDRLASITDFDKTSDTSCNYTTYFDSVTQTKSSEGCLSSAGRTGPWTEYFVPTERIKKKVIYLDNKLNGYCTWYDSASTYKIAEGIYVLGKRKGPWTFYLPGTQDTLVIKTYENDIPNGYCIYFDSFTHKRDYEGNYINHKKDGKWTYYFANGKTISSIRNFRIGISEGEFITFDSATGHILKKGVCKENKRTGIWLIYYPGNNNLQSQLDYAGNEIKAVYYDSLHGFRSAQGQFKNDKKEGKWKYYYDDTRLKSEIQFHNSKMEGSSVYYDSVRQYKNVVGQFENDKKEGKWRFYYNETRLMSEINFHNDKKDGYAIYYDSATGKKEKEGKYREGLRQGEWFSYEPMARIKTEQINFLDNKRHGDAVFYFANSGLKKSEGNYYQGKREGRWTYYYEHGGPISQIENYQAGMLDGKVICYDSLGKIISSATFKNDTLTGERIQYYPGTDIVWIKANYLKGLLDGELRTYFESGKLKRLEKYNRGEMISGACYNDAGVEVQPTLLITKKRFQGDIMTYIGDNLRYPQDALDNKVEGKVLVKFIVNENGSISDVEVIKGIGYGCDEEAIRIVSQMPPWIPEMVDDKPIKTSQTLNIVFWIH